MSSGSWKDRLLAASVRVEEHGFAGDLSSLSTAELWAIYKLVSRRAAAAQGAPYLPATNVARRTQDGGGV